MSPQSTWKFGNPRGPAQMPTADASAVVASTPKLYILTRGRGPRSWSIVLAASYATTTKMLGIIDWHCLVYIVYVETFSLDMISPARRHTLPFFGLV